MRSLRASVLLLVTALVVAGCGLFRVEGPAPPAFSDGPEALAQWLRNHVGGAASVKALLQVSLRAPQGSLSFDGLLFSARPSTLRLQGFSPMGQRLFDLVTQEGQVTLRIDSEQRTVEGTIDELGAGLQLPALPQLLGLLATMTIVPPDLSQRVVLEEAEGRSVALAFYLGAGDAPLLTRRIWLDRRGLPREEAWYDGAGQRTSLVHYDRYHVIEERWQPREIAAELTGDVRVKVMIKELQQNPAWRPDDFQIHGGAGAAARG
jgi:outer membrane biogenesis lipoprotein LolB